MILYEKVIIKAQAKDIFDYLEVFEKQKLWISGLEKIEQVKDANHNDAFIIYLKEGKKVVAYNGYTKEINKPNKLVVVMYNDSFNVETTYKIERIDDNSCNFFYKSDLKVETITGKILLCTIGYLFSKLIMKSHIKKLKKVVEANIK